MIPYTTFDPRAKLAFTTVVALLAVLIPDLYALATLGAILLVVVAIGPQTFRVDWMGTLAPFKILIPIILLLNAFFYGSGTVLWGTAVLGVPVNLTVGGVHASAVIAARLVVLAGIASWFSLTTDAEEFEAALTRLGVPWSFAFVLSLTVRLVPEMRDRYHAIEEAQLSRGVVIEGGPIKRARARVPMFIPFFVSIVNYGYELTEALTIRDYGRHANRTTIVRLEHGPMDYACYLVSIALIVGFTGIFLL